MASGTGNFATSEIRCRYHAWRWNLDGQIIEVVDRHDYPPTLTDDDVRLGEVQVGRWGGFVFVNLDPNCQPFDSFLGDMPELFASYRMEELRFLSLIHIFRRTPGVRPSGRYEWYRYRPGSR